MAEPTPIIKDNFKDAISTFWDLTPATKVFKYIVGSNEKDSGSLLGGVLGYVVKSIGESETFRNVLKQAMPQSQAMIETFLVKMGLPKEDAEGFANYLNGLQMGSPIIDFGLRLIVGIGTALKMTGAIWEVANQAIARTINRKASLQPGDFDSLYRDLLLNPTSDRYFKLVDDLGLNPSWRLAMENARKLIVNPQEITELYRRAIWDDETAAAYLKQNGYDSKNQRELLLKLAINLPPITTLLEMNKRGEIKETEAIEAIRKWGFDDSTIGLLVKESKPLFGLSEVVPLTLRGYMEQREATERLKKLGYNDKDIDHINKLALKPIGENALFQLRWRNFISDADFTGELKKLGYNPKDAKRMQDILWQPAPPTDTIRFAVREVYSPDIAKKFGLFEDFPTQFAVEAGKVGIAEETARQYWAAHWQLPAPGQGYDMYHRGIIDVDELKMLLKALDVMPFWRDKMVKLSDSLITRRQLRQLLQENIETPAKVSSRYFALGFSKEDSDTLVRLDLATIEKDFKDITKADIVNAFVQRIIEEGLLREWLADLNYSAAAQDFYVADAHRRRYIADKAKDATPNEEQADNARSTLTNDIITQYQSGMVSRETALTMLGALEYWETTADFFLQHADLQQLKKDLEYYAAQIKRMFDANAIDALEANRQLATKGYDVTSAGKMVAKWDYERYADAVVKSVKVTQPTKAEFKKWVKTGIASVDEYNVYLFNLGYDESTRINYITELMLEFNTETL